MEIQGIQRITQHKAFEKELSRLGKKYRTIPEDLRTFIDVSVRAVHLLGQKPEDMGHFPIQGLGIENHCCFIAKRFTCKSLMGKGSKSGIRVVYRFEKDTLDLLLIELFHKKDKKLPDLKRVKSILESDYSDN